MAEFALETPASRDPAAKCVVIISQVMYLSCGDAFRYLISWASPHAGLAKTGIAISFLLATA